MTDELLKHRIKRELRSRGVRINRLLLDVSDDRIVVSGEVATHYEVQLIQIIAKSLGQERQIYNNLSVVPGVLDTHADDPLTKTSRNELHRLRNRLNELTLATRLLKKQLDLGDLAQAKVVVAKMLKSIGSVDSQLRDTDAGLSHLSLLVIEDDTHQNLLLTGLLRRIGADVARASDAEIAYRVLNEGFTPDIVLLDMHLPVEDGPSIARAIRNRPHCEAARIIALSGTHPSDVGLSLDDGEVDAWLPKPINVDKLIQTIRKFSQSKRDISRS
ncbi:MAG: response regulator [Rubripirellula sp.]